MENEEINKKALELAGLTSINDDERYYQPSKCAIYDKCLEMAKWKDEQVKKTVTCVWLSSIMCLDHTISNKDHQYIDLDELKNILEDFFHINLEEE